MWWGEKREAMIVKIHTAENVVSNVQIKFQRAIGRNERVGSTVHAKRV